MFTIYAIDRRGRKHLSPHAACETLEEAMEDLDELMAHGAMDAEPDKPFFVRYGIEFTDDGAAAIWDRLKASV